MWNVSITVGIAAGLSWGLYFATAHAGLDFFDEGYLWYGVLRTLEGEVPLRDFQSYDPGRYYWCAAWSLVFGDGILGVRAALSLVQTLGLTCGLLAARRITANPAALSAIGVLLLMWMFPRNKLIEPSLSLIAVLLTLRVLEVPTLRRHLVLGLSLGITAFFGRNHGLYCGAGQVLALGLLYGKQAPPEPLRKLSAWAAGVGLGYSPMLAMVLLVPGFGTRFAQSLFELNPMPLPVPWPWVLVSMGAGGFSSGAILWFLSLAYVVMAIAYPIGLWLALRTPASKLPERALMVAATCVGVGYIHHATSRAGLPHLAQSAAPLLLLLLSAPAAMGWSVGNRTAWALRGVLAVVTGAMFLGGFDPQLRALGIWPYSSARVASYDAAGETLQLQASMAAEIESIEAVVRREVPGDEPLFIIPYRVTYYPLLGRRSPVWGIFFIRAAQGESDEEIVRKLEERGVDWVLYTQEILHGLTGDFPALRPGVASYLRREFEPVNPADLPPPYSLLRRRL